MTAPTTPTEDEVRAAKFKWEYEQSIVDVSEMADPPNSKPPPGHYPPPAGESVGGVR